MNRAKWVAVTIVTGCGIGTLVGPHGRWTPEEIAAAADRRVSALEALATSSGHVRRVQVLEELRRIDSADSWKALESLSSSKDTDLAVLAISAIARSGNAKATRRLETILEDATRSSATRSFALTAWCSMKADEDATWDDIKTYVNGKTARNSELEDTAAAIKAERFAGGAR